MTADEEINHEREPEEIEAPLVLNCAYCSEPIEPGDAFCIHCGFPLQGTEEEQRSFRTGRMLKEDELDEMKRKVRSAYITIFALSGLFFLAGIYYFASLEPYQNPGAVLLVNWIVCFVYIGLGLWCRTQPVSAIISGLIFYAIITVLNAIESPSTLVSGIILKVIILGFLITGLNSAYKAQQIKKELQID
jgi:hypothetical protein